MEEKREIKDSWVAYLTGEPVEKPAQEVTDSETFRELDTTWELAGTTYCYNNSDPDKAWTKLSGQINPETRVINLKRYALLKYAAIFIALFALGSVTFLLLSTTPVVHEQFASVGEKLMTVQTVMKPSTFTTITLPDGSTVKINANSKLEYPEKFTGSDRRVRLSGEAYFDVIHDASHPFLVEISNVEVEDIGTSFNISAYPGKSQYVVNVVSGSVRLSDKNQNESTILTAGTSGKFINETRRISVSKEFTPNFLSWITKELSFRHTPLSLVFEELENIYHIPIVIADPQVATISYTANFEKFQLEDIVNVIATTHHLSVKKQANGFVFSLK